MKKFAKCRLALKAALGIAVLAAFFACSNSAMGTRVEGGGQTTRKITGIIENFSAISPSARLAKNARAIVPNFGGYSDYKYLLYGKSIAGDETSDSATPANKWISVSPDTDGKFTIDLKPALWDLCLVALPTGSSTTLETDSLNEVKSKVTLWARCSVDLSIAKNSAKFTLTPDGLTTPGTLAIKVGLDSWSVPTAVQKVEFALLDMQTGEIIKYTGSTDKVQLWGDKSGTSPNFAYSAINNKSADDEPGQVFGDAGTPPSKTITAGTYNFVAKFYYSDPATNPDDYEIFSDSLMILPGKTTSNNVLIPKFLGTAPTAPTDLSALWDTASVDTLPEKYNVIFGWNDNSNNEKGFKLQILDVADETTFPADDDSWDNATATPVEFTHEAINTIECVGGSLSANNNAITLRLELEKKYAARICATNRAGDSAWAYVDFTKGTPDTTHLQFTATGTKTINVFRITYHLQGGTYTMGTGYTAAKTTVLKNPTNADQGTLRDYFTNDLPTTIRGPEKIKPETPDPTKDYLIKAGSEFKGWINSSGTSVTEVSSLTAAKNSELFAQFSNDALAIIDDAANYVLQPGWIKVGQSGGTEANLTASGTSATVTLARNTHIDSDGKVTWTLTVPGTGTNLPTDFTAYDSVSFYSYTKIGTTSLVKYNVKADGTAVTFEQNLSGLGSGSTFQVTFSAVAGPYCLNFPVIVSIVDGA